MRVEVPPITSHRRCAAWETLADYHRAHSPALSAIDEHQKKFRLGRTGIYGRRVAHLCALGFILGESLIAHWAGDVTPRPCQQAGDTVWV